MNTTECKYEKQLDIFPSGKQPINKETNMKLVLWDMVLFDHDSTWRQIDEFAVIHGFDNYYDMWQHAYYQGDERMLPYKFEWVHID